MSGVARGGCEGEMRIARIFFRSVFTIRFADLRELSVLVLRCSIEGEILHSGDGRHCLADVGQQLIVTFRDREVLKKEIGVVTY